MEKITKTSDTGSVKYQYAAAIIVNIATVAFGIAEGWTSPAVFLLTSIDTPLPSGKITMEEATWIASLLSVGCMFGNFFFGWVTNRFGRKLPLFLITIPIIISWILILFAPNVSYIYVARLLNGLFGGGGGYSIVPIFLSEVADDRVRGTLVSSLVLSENFGMLLGFVFGHYFDYYMVPQFVISLMAIFAVLLIFCPESPSFLLSQNKVLQAKQSIRFYQNLCEGQKGDKLVEIELNKLRKTVNHANEEKVDKKSFKWSDLAKNPARKSMIIGFVMVTLNNFSGVTSMLNYTANIFDETGSNMHPNISAIMVGMLQVFGNLVATNLIDRTGRKFLFAVSNFGTALGLTVLGLYMMLKSKGYPVDTFNWVPVMSFSFVLFVAALGVVSLPLVVFTECTQEKIRDFGVTAWLSIAWLFSFVLIKYLPILTDSLGFDVSMFLFAGVCLVGEIFIMFCVPETRGKSHDEIIDMLL